jgi:hypothetical protein
MSPSSRCLPAHAGQELSCRGCCTCVCSAQGSAALKCKLHPAYCEAGTGRSCQQWRQGSTCRPAWVGPSGAAHTGCQHHREPFLMSCNTTMTPSETRRQRKQCRSQKSSAAGLHKPLVGCPIGQPHTPAQPIHQACMKRAECCRHTGRAPGAVVRGKHSHS